MLDQATRFAALMRVVLPAGMAALIVLLSLWLWSILHGSARDFQRVSTERQADLALLDVTQSLDTALSTVERIARRWQTESGLTSAEQQREARNLVAEHGAIAAMVLTSLDGDMRWKVPELGTGLSSLAMSHVVSSDAREVAAKLLARTRIKVFTGSTPGELELAVSIPLFHGRTLVGLLTCIFDRAKLFSLTTQEFAEEGYAGTVSLDGVQVFAFRPQGTAPRSGPDGSVERSTQIAESRLRVRMEPWQQADPLSPLSTANVTLLAGLLVAMLAGTAVRLHFTARRHMVDALKASDELDRFFRLSPDPMLIMGIDSSIRRINDAFAEGLGYAPEELLGRTALELVVPEDLERSADALAGLTPSTPIKNLLARLQSKDGSWRWQSWQLVSDPAQARLFAAGRDVTEQKQAEQALRESYELLEQRVRERTQSLAETVADLEKTINQRDRYVHEMVSSESKYQDLIEGSLQGIVIHDQLKPLFCNDTYAHMHGYEAPKDVLALDSILPFYAPNEQTRVLTYLQDQSRGRPAPTEYEYEGRTRNGDPLWVLVHARGIKWSGTNAVQAALIDITKRKEAQEATERQAASIAASEQRHRHLLDSLPHALLIVDREGQITDVNAQTTRLFGHQREALIGQQIEMLVPERNRVNHSGLRARYQEHPESRAMGAGMDLFGLRKDGSEFPVDITLSPDPTLQGLEIICSITDMTERRELQEQMAAAQKMETIGQLAGGVAHDFNNMLAVILSYGNFVLEAVEGQDSVREDVEQVIAAAKRSAALTRQLLAFSRRQVLKLEDSNLNDIVSGMEKMLQRLIGEDVQLTTRLAPGLASVQADTSQMEQVLLNLAVNARDAMPMGGQLVLETSNVNLDEAYVNSHIEVEPGQYVMLSVSDTGIGMDEATRARLFEPFFTTKELGKGTGLGLSTVYGIVKQLKGSIFVYSEPGQGSTFKIFLPQVASRVVASGPQASIDPEPPASESILLVEDEQQVRAAAQRILESVGYRVHPAADGGEALALAEQDPTGIDLLLTDVVMPNMSGVELAAHLQSLRPGLPVLFMTGYTEGAISQHGVLKEGVEVVFKPFSKGSLLKQVRHALVVTARSGRASEPDTQGIGTESKT